MAQQGKNWGIYFKRLFDEGRDFTQQLLKENENLRQRVAILEHGSEQQGPSQDKTTADLRLQLEQVCVERDGLAAELASIKERLADTERENQEFAHRYVEIERQNEGFAGLYVASYQLHSALDVDTVLRTISDIAINLIGAEVFALYLYDPAANAFTLSAGEGLPFPDGHRVPVGEDLLSNVARSGKLYVASSHAVEFNTEQPMAALPLVAAGEVVGVLLIHKLLEQKTALEAIDLELFDLLASHAATALMAAQLYTRTQRKASTLEGFLQLLR